MLLWMILMGCAGRLGFWMHHDDYEAVVALVRAQPLAAETMVMWKVDDLDAPAALLPLSEEDRWRGAGRGRVWAVRSESGALSVFIETVDNGHAGESGVAFIEPGSPGWDPDRDGELWSIGPVLSGHWRRISYDLG